MSLPDATSSDSAVSGELTSLDLAETYDRLDPHGLLGRIEGLPQQMEDAWSAASAVTLPDSARAARRVAVIGMGGSGIGGLLLQALGRASGWSVPVEVVRGYMLPAHLGSGTLVFASSNSGNTEEALSATEQALAAGATCVVITAGGRLADVAREHSLPLLEVRWSWEPRAALGWSFASLLAFVSRASLTPDVADAFHRATGEMRRLRREIAASTPEERNKAKQLARRLAGTIPVIIGAEALAPVAYRWRTQVNENAKQWAIADELPEMNHNAPVGYALPANAAPLLHVILLRAASTHARVRLRIAATHEQMEAAGLAVEVLDVAGDDVLGQMLCGAYLGDYASYYLGLLNGAEPSPVAALDWLKSRMAAS